MSDMSSEEWSSPFAVLDVRALIEVYCARCGDSVRVGDYPADLANAKIMFPAFNADVAGAVSALLRSGWRKNEAGTELWCPACVEQGKAR